MKKIRMIWIWSLLLVLLIVVAGCGGGSGGSGETQSQEETRDYYKVGVITSLSGAEVYGGNLTRRGYDTWAETVNAKGGIQVGDKQYLVEMFYADDQSDPAAGADAVERLITREGVDFLLGPYTSGSTLGVAPILEKYKVPMITGSAESPLIWEQKFKYTFGTIPAVNLTGSYPVKTLVEEVSEGAKSIAIIGVNDAFSKATADAFKGISEELNIEVVKFDIVPAGTDFTPLLSAIKELKPDILAVGGHEKEHMEIIKASKGINFAPKAFLMHYGVTNPDFVKNLGKDAEGVYGAAVWTMELDLADPLFGSTKEFGEIYRNRWGDFPDYTAAACAATGEVFEAALEKIGAAPPLSEAERDSLATALEDIKVDTFYGPVQFAKDGAWYHNNTGLTALTIQIQNGEVKIVGPVSSKMAEPIFPLPAWDQR